MRRASIGIALGLFLVAGCGSPTVNVLESLSVLNWSPHDGATCIQTDAVLGVCLSREVDGASLSNVTLRASDAQGALTDEVVTATITASDVEPACLLIQPGAPLQQGRVYWMVLGAELSSDDGTQLGRTLSSRFWTEDTSCP